MAEYRYYLIPDAMTRAFPEQFGKQTPTEFFDNIADLEKRYHQLREMPYNNERTWNERTRFPYARLVVGIDRQNPDGAVAIIQVRNGVNYLCDDYRGPYADRSDAQIPQMAKKLVEVIGVDRVRPHTYTQRDGYTWVQVEKDMHITEWLYAHERKPFLQPLPDSNAETVVQYLKRRGIDGKILKYCINQGILYQTTRSGYKNCVFIGMDSEGKPRSASLRGCQGIFRGECAGSAKRYGFCIPPKNTETDLAEVYEAPIDLLSGATLHLMKGHDWRQNHYVSLGGLNYVALDNYLENHPEIHKLIYKPLIKSGYKIACPTLTDLYNDLKEQPHERAHEIALALELFATGSMNMFAHPTNVDMSNRLICFNIQSLGDQLKPVAMLSMLEYINTCVMSNERNDPKAATWVYFDEIYLLLRDKLSSQFLYTSWKRFRKYNAYATGITQNVQDCLSNDTAYAMLANSEFVCMLRQTKDIDSVVELYGLSDPQKNYLKLAKPGQGILKMGNNLIPFVNDHPTNTKIYRLLTTKPGEMEN